MKKHTQIALFFGCLLFVAHAIYCCVPIIYKLPSERSMQKHALQIFVRRLALACRTDNVLDNLYLDDLNTKRLLFLPASCKGQQINFVVLAQESKFFRHKTTVINVSLKQTNGYAKISICGIDAKDIQQLRSMFNYYLGH